MQRGIQIPKRVTVICLGNMCRSPAGEFLLRYYAKKSVDSRIQAIEFDSAGLNGGYNGMDPLTIQYLQRYMLSGDHFQSKRLTKPYLLQFDLILVMERYMINEITERIFWNWSEAEKTRLKHSIKVFSQVAELQDDIEDPYGFHWDQYQDIMKQIDDMAQTIIKKWENQSN